MSLSDNSLQIRKYNNKGTNSADHSTDNIVQNTEYINAKTRELYQMDGTMVDSYKSQYNQTMIAGAMWTVLATSLVYYVFNQI
jgi:hypothetical protein